LSLQEMVVKPNENLIALSQELLILPESNSTEDRPISTSSRYLIAYNIIHSVTDSEYTDALR